MHNINEEVVAIRDANDATVNIYGYGVYVGEEVPPVGTLGVFGIDLGELNIANPKIILDSGEIVWGCQCWWGNKEKFMNEQLGNREIVIVSLCDDLQEITDHE